MTSTPRRTKILVRVLGILPLLLLMNVSAASAADFLSIPISGVVTGAEGEVRQVASAEVPADYVGEVCQVLGQTENQESVHDSNDLLIETGGQVLTIANFEDEGFVTYDSGEVVALGTSIEVSVRFGPDGVSSGGFRLRVTCGDVEVEPCVPTEDVPCEAPTTTTTVPECVPTDDVPCEEATTTTVTECVPTEDVPCEEAVVPPPKGPTIPGESSTTVPVPAGPEVEPQLPVTGSRTGGLIAVGLLLLASGVLASVLARGRSVRHS